MYYTINPESTNRSTCFEFSGVCIPVYFSTIRLYQSDTENSFSDVEMENVQESNSKITNTLGLVVETRFTNEATNMEKEDCSTSDVTNQESVYCSRRLRRSRSHASGLSRHCKRWRGRAENLNCTNDESYTGTSEDATADKVCLNFKDNFYAFTSKL
jgi:hypothetical protein